MLSVCKVCCVSLAHIRNEARLREIKKELVDEDNYADGAASMHLGNVEKNWLEIYLIAQLFQPEMALSGNKIKSFIAQLKH